MFSLFSGCPTYCWPSGSLWRARRKWRGGGGGGWRGEGGWFCGQLAMWVSATDCCLSHGTLLLSIVLCSSQLWGEWRCEAGWGGEWGCEAGWGGGCDSTRWANGRHQPDERRTAGKSVEKCEEGERERVEKCEEGERGRVEKCEEEERDRVEKCEEGERGRVEKCEEGERGRVEKCEEGERERVEKCGEGEGGEVWGEGREGEGREVWGGRGWRSVRRGKRGRG